MRYIYMDYHDYGKDLYCTENFDSAQEWACQWRQEERSFVYEYSLNLQGLIILDLSKKDMLYSLALLAERRFESDEPRRRREKRLAFVKKYYVNLSKYDIVIGWRADDKYFNFLKNFLRGDISVEATKKAFSLGELGLQTVVLSEKAYSQKTFSKRHDIKGDDYVKYRSSYHAKVQTVNKILLEVQDMEGGGYIDELVKEE